MEAYSTFDVCKILNIKRVTLQSWLKDGFIIPSFKTTEGRGPGEKSIFKREQLYFIRLFQVLIKHDIGRKTASSLLRRLSNSENPNDSEENWIVIFKGNKDAMAGEAGFLPTYCYTGSVPPKFDEFKLTYDSKHFGRFEFFIGDYEMVITINFKKIKTEVDVFIDEYQG